MNSFYILIQSQTIMDGKFIDFYNNYIKSHTNNDFIADIYCVFNSVLVRVAVCSKCIIIQIEI